MKILEYETPNFMLITNPEDYALVTAIYRSSVDGRKYMSEAIIANDPDDDNIYHIPDNFTSRAVQILQVYLKSLGVRMSTVIDDEEFIGEAEHKNDTVAYVVNGSVIFCSTDEMYYLMKLHKVYKRYIKEYPHNIDDIEDVWEYIMEHLPFKKKHLTERIIELFEDNLVLFSR